MNYTEMEAKVGIGESETFRNTHNQLRFEKLRTTSRGALRLH